MRLILSSIAAIAFLALPTIVAAQSTSPKPDNSPSFELPQRTPRNPSRPAEPPAPPEEYEKKIEDIQNLVNSNKQVKTMCANYINDIEYQFLSNKLQIDTGNNSCAFTIIKEVIQPQLAEGKLRTYEYTGDREGIIVTF
ncbi:hypothetical protein H6G17_16025 [Chroococcidiopsis sp. FACHB-1243]|uniref:hypothetical protein n=1 Tax=Chroococcidiopsis sp. [FACHB-1243] TaxID=2692781 RepID=UPI001782D02E|nr:hypothetical protein [Chroococcidiopsis sp. [FACHB-1243]]MBD2307009.1 hypothetical protein [Chroococcidiopsis sp. [FACHB-1243]]